MPKKADAHLLGIKVGGLQEGRQVPVSSEAKYIGARAESRFVEGFGPYEDLYVNVIKPAIPPEYGEGMHGMFRSVGYKVYKNLKNIRDADTARKIVDGIVADFIAKYGKKMESGIRAVADAVLAKRGFK